MAVGTSLIASGAGATLQTVMGILDFYEGKKMEKKAAELEKQTTRPVYGIPESEQRYLNLAQKQAMIGMDEQQRQRYIDQINRTAAYTLQAGARTGGGIQGVSAAQMNLNDANANLLTMDNQQKQQNIQNYMAALQNYAPYQDKAFAYNLDQPYQDNAAAIRGLKQAGLNAKYAGSQTVANAGASFAGSAGTAINTLNTSGGGAKYESTQSPYYTGYGQRGTAVQQIDTVNTPTQVANPYYVDTYSVNPKSTQISTGTTNVPVAGYGVPSQKQWENENPYNSYYVR